MKHNLVKPSNYTLERLQKVLDSLAQTRYDSNLVKVSTNSFNIGNSLFTTLNVSSFSILFKSEIALTVIPPEEEGDIYIIYGVSITVDGKTINLVRNDSYPTDETYYQVLDSMNLDGVTDWVNSAISHHAESVDVKLANLCDIVLAEHFR